MSGLRVGDIDFVRGRLEIQHTVVESGGVQFESTPKDYEARSVPVPSSILDELAVLVEGRRSGELGHASAAVTLDVYANLFDADTDALRVAIDRVASRPIASISRPPAMRAAKGGGP